MHGWTWSNDAWSKEISGKLYKLSFTLLVNKENDEHMSSAEAIKENLLDIGINVTLKQLSWNDYKNAITDGTFELALASFDIKNELTIIDILSENGKMNYSKYSSEKMKEAINKVKKIYNRENMEELENVYKSDTPYIGLYFRNNTILTNKSVKGSIEPTYFNPYEEIFTWCK